jgi:8-oxo-dGTP pyrophosphatase MutT (NUDIX family)
MYTKNTIKQESSGGFIFTREEKDNRIYVLLIENIKGEQWVPKGKIESGESHLDAALREIEEETGGTKKYLIHLGECGVDSYGYDLDEQTRIEKDFYVQVFASSERYPLLPGDWNEMRSLSWVIYEKALEQITFTKNELQEAYAMFLDFEKNNKL